MIAIVRRTASIVTFLGLVGFSCSAPQAAHLERFIDAIVVAPRRKTLADLACLELDGIDPSNFADWLRISPWDSSTLRLRVATWVIKYLLKDMGNNKKPIYLSLDDCLVIKNRQTQKLESVDWHYDHNRHRTERGCVHVVLRIHWGDCHFPLLWRLYQRAHGVRRRNKKRCKSGLAPVPFRSKLTLAQEMLEQIRELLPAHVPVYVLFDSWYTAAWLVKWIRRQGWHVIAAVKANRLLNGKSLTTWHKDLKKRRYQRVRLQQANGRRRTYFTRLIQGRLEKVPLDVSVVISKKAPGATAPKYFLCTDPKLSAQQILTRYQKRWSQEVDNWTVKLQLGLGDFRVQSYEAIEKWYTVVYLTLTFLYWQKYERQKQTGVPVSLSEVMAEIRRDHRHEVLRQVIKEARAGVSEDEILERYTDSFTVAA